MPLFTDASPVRPDVRPALFTVCTRICEVPRAGAVRAITARFWIDADGLATFDRVLTEPSALCCVGLRPTEFVTFAPFREAAVRRVAPRFMAWPFTKALRLATVTALTLCAFTKLKLRAFLLNTFVSRMNVLRTLIRVMNSRRQ